MRDWLSHRAATTPGAPALIDTETERRRSFADLDQVVDRAAGHLSALGVEGGDHVGVVLEDRLASIKLLWAAMRLGAVHVPLRPAWDAETLRARAAEADVTAVVCGESTEGTAVAADAPITTIAEPRTDEVTEFTETDPVSVAPSTWTRSEPMTIAFTAGTTGDPRPVVLEMGNHFANATDTAFRFGALPADRWLSCHPLHHISGLTVVLRAMLFGNALVVQAESDPGGLVDTLDTYDVSCLTAPPSTVRGMLNARGMLPDSLRGVIVTGAPVPPAMLDRCRGYSIPVLPAYSLTEAAGYVTTAAPGAVSDRSGSVGHPLLRTEVTVVDADGTAVGRGQTGELVVSGPSVTPGYYDPDAGGPIDGNVHGVATGDIGFRDEDGHVHVISRRDDRILVSGETVRTGDVRTVICEHDGVADAAVVGIPDAEWGERPAALIVRSDSFPELDAETLREHCNARLAGFVAPKRFAFASALPRGPSGDIDRRAVRKRVLRESSERTSGSTTRSEGAWIETTEMDAESESEGSASEDGTEQVETEDEPEQVEAEDAPEQIGAEDAPE